jgi:hypothetical protein
VNSPQRGSVRVYVQVRQAAVILLGPVEGPQLLYFIAVRVLACGPRSLDCQTLRRR